MAPPIPERRQEAPKKPVNKEYRPEELKTLAEKMRDQQASPEYTEGWEDFTEDLSVEVAMGKDMEKRPGSERGEDMFLADKETGLTGVFDGLGGEGQKGSGANASGMAALFAPSLYKIISKKLEQPGAADAQVKDVIKAQTSLEHPSKAAAMQKQMEADWAKHPPAVRKEAVALFETVKKLSQKVQETGGMTTATLGKTVKTADGRMFEIIANVGDGGATHIDANGAEDVTKEDSVLDYLLSQGAISPEQAADPNFKVEALGGRPVSKVKTMMYQALGKADMEPVPRISIIELQPGDEVVYATDGIRDEFSDAKGEFDAAKAKEILGRGNAGAESLVRAAAKEGKQDKKDEKTVLRKRVAEIVAIDDVEEIEPDEIELNDSDIVEG